MQHAWFAGVQWDRLVEQSKTRLTLPDEEPSDEGTGAVPPS